MSDVVFDASVLLALVLREPIIDLHEKVDEAKISAVNFAEVVTSLRDKNPPDLYEERLLDLVEVVPFSKDQALVAALLRSSTRHLGLSLGDRCCLALGIITKADVYTADRAWLALSLPCSIQYIRPV